MADGFTPVALSIKPPDPNQAFDTLSNVLGLQSKRIALQKQAQDLQTGAATQQSAQAEAQGAQQQMQERQKLMGVMKSGVRDDNGQSIYNDNNEIDPKQLQDYANRNLPLTGQQVIQNITKTQSDKTALAGAVGDLADKNRDEVSGIIRSLVNNPKATAADAQGMLQDYAKQNPAASAAVLSAIPLVSHIDAAQDMKSKNDMLIHLAQQFQPAATTAGQQAPSISTMQGPKGLQPVQTNPLAPGGIATAGAPLQQGIPPGYQMINGQLVQTSAGGGLSLPQVGGGAAAPGTAPGGGGQPGAPPAAKLQAMPRPAINANPGDVARYNATMDANRQHVQDVSAAANDLQNGVGPTRYRNDQIQDILNSKTFSPTGPGASQLNWISSKLPGEAGDAFQKIGHYLAQNSAAIAQKMGVPGTNMGAEQAAAASGNTSQNRGALLEITKVNDAMNTGLDMYNRGLAKVTANGADPSKVNAYRQAFGQNFNMNVLRYDDALRRGDKAEIDSIVKQQGPAGMKQMGAQRRILHSLSDTGDLP